MSTLTAPAPAAVRSPWTVRVLAGVVLLLATVTSYGAIYFSFVYEDPDPGVGSWLFVVAFLSINVAAAASAVGLVRGRRWAWNALLGYGIVGILWCIAKLVFWSETESLVFGVANLAGLALLYAPPTRRHIR